MKRFIALLLAFLYVGVSSGNSLYLHYCMGKFKGMTLTQDRAKHCDKCGMLKSRSIKQGCCKEKKQQVKVEKNQRVSSYDYQLNPLFPVYLNSKHSNISCLKLESIAERFPVGHEPPTSSGQPLYLLIRTFRI